MVFEYAAMGMNILQNFHGMNDARCLTGVAQAVAEAQAAGHDIIAQGTICIEDNPNISIEDSLSFARELIDMGHQGFYLKSASGRLDPDFVYHLATALYQHFPDQDMTIHAHSTYGVERRPAILPPPRPRLNRAGTLPWMSSIRRLQVQRHSRA